MTNFIIDHWEALTFIVALIFNGGVMYKTFKDKPSVKVVNQMITKAFTNHCPFEGRIAKLELWKDELVKDNVLVARTLVQETERTHLASQRIELNLRRVCDKLDVIYLDTK